MTDQANKLRMGMVGGGRDAFIGAVHRMAAQLDGGVTFCAGALSSSPEKSLASGQDLGLADDRNYPTWQAMLEGELARDPDDRIDFVSIVTPNDSHYEIAAAFAKAGFNVVLDKPMVQTPEQAAELRAAVEDSGVVFAVTYNYSGYPMVKLARDLVETGELGSIRKVVVEYNQGWLATKLEDSGQKQAEWRTDPKRSGVGGAVGDIGSHAQHLVSYITGMEIDRIAADLTCFVPNRPIDDDANVLMRFKGGAKGVLFVSQICVGNRNDLRIRVWGTKGGIEWHQEDPDHLLMRTPDGPEKVYHRAVGDLPGSVQSATRLPSGHPEAFIEAFGNIYREATRAMRERAANPDGYDYPTVSDGELGVRFIHAAVCSSAADASWIDLSTLEQVSG